MKYKLSVHNTEVVLFSGCNQLARKTTTTLYDCTNHSGRGYITSVQISGVGEYVSFRLDYPCCIWYTPYKGRYKKRTLVLPNGVNTANTILRVCCDHNGHSASVVVFYENVLYTNEELQ